MPYGIYSGATVAPLRDGRLFIVGGTYSWPPSNSTALYDPLTGRATNGPLMTYGRSNAQLVPMLDGRIFITAGDSTGGNYSEIYDPAAGTITPTAAMPAYLGGAARAVALNDGRVFMAYQDGGNGYFTGMLYDPATQQFSTIQHPSGGIHSSFTLTLLGDGRVLILGDNRTDFFNPSTGTFQTAPYVGKTITNHSAILLPNGRVLVVGNNSGFNAKDGIVYDPASGPLYTHTMTYDRTLASLFLLPSGKVLVQGGSASPGTAEYYDPYAFGYGQFTTTTGFANSSYTTGAVLADGRAAAVNYNGTQMELWLHRDATPAWSATTGTLGGAGRLRSAPVVLPDGRIFYCGGYTTTGTVLASGEIYDPATRTFSATPGSLATARYDHTATLMPNGKVLIAGGWGGASALASTEWYDPATGMFSPAGTQRAARTQHRASLLANNRLLLVGGNSNGFDTAEIYDAGSGQFLAVGGGMTFPLTDFPQVVLYDGRVLIPGGYSNYIGNTSSNGLIYDPVANTLTYLMTAGAGCNTYMNFSRQGHSGTLLPDGRVLLAGGRASSVGAPLAHYEFFDPVCGFVTGTSPLNSAVSEHAAWLLDNGTVALVAGMGTSSFANQLQFIDFASATPIFRTLALPKSHQLGIYAPLPDGSLLVAGGYDGSGTLASAVTVDLGLGIPLTRSRPTLATLTNPLPQPAALSVTGTGLLGDSQGGSGNFRGGIGIARLVLRGVNNELRVPRLASAAPGALATVSLSGLPFGYYRVKQVAGGVPSAEQSIRVIQQPPSISTGSLPNGEVGLAYSQSIAASGGLAPLSYSVVSGLPAGLSLSPGGLLSGNPTTSGAANLGVRVTDALGSTDTRTFSFTIYPRLTINTTALPDGFVGSAYSRTFAASGGSGGRTWRLTAGLAPGGLVLSTTGVLSGTPVTAGSYNFTVQVTDSLGAAASRPYNLNIVQNFGIVSGELPRGVRGHRYPYFALQADGGFPQYTYAITAGALPAGLSMSAAGQFSGTPAAIGTFPLTISVTDSTNAVASRDLALTVDEPPALQAWTPRGQFGGRVEAVALSPGYDGDGHLFVMSDTGEIFRSVDRGLNWSRTLVLPSRAYTYANHLLVSPEYTGSVNGALERMVLFASYDIGLWRSTDRGATFSPINGNLPCGAGACGSGQYPAIIGMGISPAYRSSAELWAVDFSARVFRSTDGGTSWALQTTLPGVSGELNAIVVPSPNYSVDGLVFVAIGNKIFRGTGGGAAWSQTAALANTLGQPLTVRGLVPSPDFGIDHVMLAEAATYRIFRSTDAGSTFIDLSPASIYGQHLGVARNPFGPPVFYLESPNAAAFTYRLLLSRDLGAGFVPQFAGGMSSGDEASHALALSLAGSPGAPAELFYGTEGGLYHSADDGFSFNERDQGLGANVVYGVAGSQAVVSAAYKGGWFKSADRAANRVKLAAPNAEVNVRDVLFTAVSPDYANDHMIFLADGVALQRSVDGGQTFSEVFALPGDGMLMAFPPSFNLSTNPNVLLGTAQGLYVSSDGGQGFSQVPLPPACLSPTNPAIQGLAISPAFATDQTIWLASAVSGPEGGVCRSPDGGATWIPVLNGGARFTGPLALSPVYNHAGPNGDARTLMVYQLRSTDGGANWTGASGPAGLTGRPYFSPKFATDRTVFLAADGVFRSADGGASFAALGGGDQLKTRTVTGLHLDAGFDGAATTDSVVVAATSGSGVWRSTDGGRTFTAALGAATLSGNVNRIVSVPGTAAFTLAGREARAAGGLTAGTLLAATEGHGVFASDDGGVTFASISAGLPADARTRALAAPAQRPGNPLASIPSRGLWRYGAGSWGQVPGLATGDYPALLDTGAELYAARLDGVSLKSTDGGATFTPLAAGETNLAAMDFNASSTAAFGADPAARRKGPVMISANTASLWAVAQGAGPRYSDTGGASWVAAPGSNDYTIPAGKTWTVIHALGLDATTGGRIVLAGTTAGLYLSRDGGATWRHASGPGSGLEATSRNFSAALSTPTAFGTTDILFGASGATTGGVYLSGDGGLHWTQVNQGFDPAQLSISTLVRTACAGCPVQYYSGSYGGGLYTRTIAVVPPPAPAAAYACWGSTGCACGATPGSGPISGGQPFKLCGSNFQAGMVVEFDGVPASGCTVTLAAPQSVACTATPAHVPGAAVVRLRNPDTRAGFLPANYTYSGGASRAGNSLRVAKAGADAALSWSCAGCGGASPARIHRAQNAGFTLFPEQFNGGTGASYPDANAIASAQSYFWSVE